MILLPALQESSESVCFLWFCKLLNFDPSLILLCSIHHRVLVAVVMLRKVAWAARDFGADIVPSQSIHFDEANSHYLSEERSLYIIFCWSVLKDVAPWLLRHEHFITFLTFVLIPGVTLDPPLQLIRHS